MTAATALAELARRIAEYAGLDPPAWVLEARARERAERAGTDLDGYLARVASDGTEVEALTELLRVGETRFFRHQAQVDAVRRRVIPEREAALAGSARTCLRAWSAGCASGEEAWTLAILLAEEARCRFEVLATDLSEPALAVARAGRYSAASLEEVPATLRSRHFTVDDDQLSVAAPLRAAVRFERKNLLDGGYPGRFDLILCRNVLIYFDGAHRDQVIERLADSLLPGGYLFLGYSETLRAHEHRFEPLRADDANLIYRRRDGPAPLPIPAPAPPRGERETRPAARLPPSRQRTATMKKFPPVPLPAFPAERREPAPPAARHGAAVRLSGSYDGEGAARLTAELKPILDGKAQTIDLDGAAFLGDEAARIFSRVADTATQAVRLRASRPSVRRWLERHRLDARFFIDDAAPEGEPG